MLDTMSVVVKGNSKHLPKKVFFKSGHTLIRIYLYCVGSVSKFMQIWEYVSSIHLQNNK